MTTDFDHVQHGLEEAFDYLNRLIETDASVGDVDPDAESARDNLGNALTEYKAKTEDAHVVISGNPTEGFTLYGPYVGFEEAADKHEGDEAWITRLHTPEQAEFDL
jgi:hypothetical protein